MKGAIRMVVGLIILAGVAGSDCEGKCIENSMPIEQMILFAVVGLALFGSGVNAATKEDRNA